MLWQLTQMLWVGGLWLLHIGLLPVLGWIGLAPLLIDGIAGMLNALMVAFAAACVIFQALVLIQAEGLASLWRDIRGQLLLMALYACGMFLPCAWGGRMPYPGRFSAIWSWGFPGWCWCCSRYLDGVAGCAKHTLDPCHHLKRWTFDSCLLTLKFLR